MSDLARLLRPWRSKRADLPVDILLGIFQYLHPNEIVISCAAVCKLWAHAAKLSVTRLEPPVDTPRGRLRSLRHWLTHSPQAQQVTALLLHHAGGERLKGLFLQHLRDLEIHGGCLQLKPRHNYPNTLYSATFLTRLVLHGCFGENWHRPSKLKALTSLRQLQHLAIRQPRHSESDVRLSGKQCGKLTQLTRLELDRCIKPKSTRHLARLTNLQVLFLAGCLQQEEQLSVLQQLPALTQLVLTQPSCSLVLTGASTASLTRLQHLELLGVSFEADLLSSLTQLQHLRITTAHGNAAADASDAALLLALPQLLALTHLDLTFSLQQAQERPAYSAITSSSKLQQLDLQSIHCPHGAWGHILKPGGRPLPHLTSLKLGERSHICHTDWGLDPALHAVRLSNYPRNIPNLEFVPFSWPALQELDLGVFMQPGPALAVLQVLPGLTSLALSHHSDAEPSAYLYLTRCTGLRALRLYGEGISPVSGLEDASEHLQPLLQLPHLTRLEASHIGDAAAAQVLVRLTQLVVLDTTLPSSCRRGLTDEGLVVLTALQQLTQLRVAAGSISLDIQPACSSGRARVLELINKAPARYAPDVWSQLLQRCVRSSRAATALRDTTAALNQRLHELQQQLADLQDDVGLPKWGRRQKRTQKRARAAAH